MNLTIMLLDNNIYGLTKSQTSPTTRKGEKSNTHPKGSFFAPMSPISVMLGIANASFIAQTVDWNQAHLYETIKAAHAHRGASFIRVLQRCPHFTSHVFLGPLKDFHQLLLLDHPDGVKLDETVLKKFPNRVQHDPRDLAAARALADRTDVYPIGVFYKNPEAECYDDVTSQGVAITQADKLAGVNKALDRFLV
jgi:2-oxoglutarate ferredoxin oxidoreductase subunit beta